MTSLALIAAATCMAGGLHDPPPLHDKTLVAWVRVADLDSRGGSVLTIQDDDEQFDALVYGELSPRRWMAGSDFFRRTAREQESWPAEDAAPTQVLQIAASWRGNVVTLFRDGRELEHHSIEQPQEFGDDAIALIGLRHLAAGDGATFHGSVLDARIYGEALDAEALRALVLDVVDVKTPNATRAPISPISWWSFENGSLEDSMHRFPKGRLVGAAHVANGELVLPGGASYFVAGGGPLRTRATEDWPVWHVTARPDEGVCLPYDSNGCIFWRGRYHLMYIFQDPRLPDGGHCWGHASSTNLVDWTFHPPALVPAPGDPDHGIFSGNAFVNREGRPMLCWFGIDAGVCVATAEDDDLIHWKKHPGNPIVPIPKPGDAGFGVYKVWDPYLWLDGDDYVCLLGGNTLANGKDTLYACRSKDLVKWEMLHPFFEQPDPAWTTAGEDCSCPDFFQLGDRHVLMCISHKVGARCYVGRFDPADVKFHPEQHVRMNWPGGTFFAPESLADAGGRRLFWGWITDPRARSTQRATGSGAQSLPRVMELARDGTLEITPAAELQALRRDRREIVAVAVPKDGEVLLDSVRGDVMELELEIDPQTATEFGVAVRCTADGGEETVIRCRRATGQLVLDMAKSTRRRDVKYASGPIDGYFGARELRTSVDAPFTLAAGERLKLRLFLDKPLLEVFANDRQCLTQQIFPLSHDALGVKLFAKGGAARLVRGSAWQLAPATFVDARGRTK